MMYIKYIIAPFFLILLTYSVCAIGGGDFPEQGSFPCGIIDSVSPDYGEEDVSPSVPTCANITMPVNCSANITFQWFDSISFWEDLFQWFLYGGIMPEYDDYLYNYSQWEGINTTGKICASNLNVTCSRQGYDFYVDWRIVVEMNCSGDITYDYCYSWYKTEECSLFYIYPEHTSTDICPCCDAMCINITNEYGHPMNITFYRNQSGFDFNQTNKLNEVENGSYCFCIDCYYIDYSTLENGTVFTPLLYNTTYYWYINVTDTILDTSENSEYFLFRTAENTSDCPCGEDSLVDLIDENDKVQNDIWILPVSLIFMMVPLIFALERRKKK